MQVKGFFDEETFTLTYVLWDEQTKDAVVIDPVLNYDVLSSQTSLTSLQRVQAFLSDESLTLRAALETHAHADHLSGSQWIKREFRVPVMIGRNITTVQQAFKDIFDLPENFQTDGSQFDRLLEDGEEVRFGSLQMQALWTPGHTPACMCYLFGDALFTGDALFMDDYGTGRCDFPNGSAVDLYRSVHGKLYELPAETRVFVGHDYLPGRALRFETTIGASRTGNPQLQTTTSEEEFVAFRTARDATLSQPKLLFQSVQVNIGAGILPPSDDDGRRFLKVPINLFAPTDDVGVPSSNSST